LFVALAMGRNCVSVDIDKRQVHIQKQRIQELHQAISEIYDDENDFDLGMFINEYLKMKLASAKHGKKRHRDDITFEESDKSESEEENNESGDDDATNETQDSAKGETDKPAKEEGELSDEEEADAGASITPAQRSPAAKGESAPGDDKALTPTQVVAHSQD
jgi:hypothetical protein